MTVKELIDYLYKCDPEYSVVCCGDEDVRWVIQHTDFTNPEESFVEIS